LTRRRSRPSRSKPAVRGEKRPWIAPLDDKTLQRVLATLNDPRFTAAPDPEALAAAQRYLDEIM
jgi:hypothetical protein